MLDMRENKQKVDDALRDPNAKTQQAKHKHLPDNAPKDDSKYLMYLGAHNLYGWSMKQIVPRQDLQFKYKFRLRMYLNDKYEI